MKITTYNPNEKIGIYYEKGGVLSVWYTENKLCEGSLPEFYHGHRNKTALDVVLTGRTVYGSTLMSALVEQQQTGRIPLQLRAVAPVAVKMGKMKLKKVKILGNCLLVVDSLTANNAITIKASNCKFRLKLWFLFYFLHLKLKFLKGFSPCLSPNFYGYVCLIF